MKSIAEAPAKAIITGEHFVVHGAWALAAALPRKVRVEVSPSASFRASSDRFDSSEPAQLLPVSRVVKAFATEYSIDPKVRVSITSQIPQGAGLGSSAATMVALSAALSKLNSLGLRIDDVVRMSMVGESQIHGRPSGIDPTICARGGALLFRPGSRPRPVKVGGARSLLVSYSGESRSTRHQINRVAATKDAYPNFFSSLTRSVGELSEMAAARLSEGDMEGLGRLLNFNHALLSSLGVSTETLDEMVDLMVSLGSYGAKLTGAGGGGSVLAVAPEGKEKSIVSGLQARGFETFQASVPVRGVRSWLEQ